MTKYQVGQKIGNITLLSFEKSTWTILCDCGLNAKIDSNKLYRTVSCGCKVKKVTKLQGALNRKYNHYVQKSKTRKIPFLLDKPQFFYLIQQNCFYCASIPNQKTSYRQEDFYFNGVDRIDSSKPYVEDNCVSSCFICNRAKGNLSSENFKTWISRLYENRCNF